MPNFSELLERFSLLYDLTIDTHTDTHRHDWFTDDKIFVLSSAFFPTMLLFITVKHVRPPTDPGK